jgi:hypothetical protein
MPPALDYGVEIECDPTLTPCPSPCAWRTQIGPRLRSEKCQIGENRMLGLNKTDA